MAAGTAAASNLWLMLPRRMSGKWPNRQEWKKLVLTHIVASEVDEAATVKAIAESFKGGVILGHDLVEIVPKGSKGE